MTENMIPAHLVGAERRVYVAGADRARASFRKRTGANTLQTIAERRDWLAVHGATMASKADAGGMSAVRRMHAARVEKLATMSDASRIGGAATGAHLATLTCDAEHAADRLAILAPSKRKPAARKLASVPDVVAAPVVILPSVASTRLRKTSRLAACTGHASYWSSLSPADRFKNAVEGGTGDACTDGACTLTPGTDRYAADFVAAGPVTLAELNNYPAPVVAEPVDVWAPVLHAVYTRQDGAAITSGPACRYAGDVATMADIEDVPDVDVTCAACVDIVASLPPAPVDIVAAAVDSGRVILVSVGEPAAARVTCPECGAVNESGGMCDQCSRPAMPDDEPAAVAPEIVPADVVTYPQIRAARKASRRELAATMRAAGLVPNGLAWQLARSGVDLADIPAILAGDAAMREGAVR